MLVIVLGLFSALSFSQTKVTTDAAGNYVTVKADTVKKADQLTGRYFTIKSGERFPVYRSAHGKLYVIRTSKKTGNQYRQYLEELK